MEGVRPMMWGFVLLLTVAVVTPQKLFFKPYKDLKIEEHDVKQELDASDNKGFGINKPQQYFTSHRTALQMAAKASVGPVVCPGNKSACPEGNTCCKVSITGFGCCPIPMATCCQDSRHCCPQGLKCDIGRQACISADGAVSMTWYEKGPSIQLDIADNKQENRPDVAESKVDETPTVEDKVDNVEADVVCPDGEHQCASGQTCCRSADGYSCCPLPDASCCSDQIHCCPQGTTCDLTHSKCIRTGTNEMLDWVEKKQPTNKPKSDMVLSIDAPVTDQISLNGPAKDRYLVRCNSKYLCRSGQTCCKKEDNSYGCCEGWHAVCCRDMVHCCPSGTACDDMSGSCRQGNQVIPWKSKSNAIMVREEDTDDTSRAIQVGNVKCDAEHECPDGNTCCKLASGDWGCCPIPNAVCCSDHEHCCPSGTTCDTGSGKCNRGAEQIDWFTKTESLKVGNVKCDSTHECPTGNTCCKLASGDWGCCPIPNAVCCSDHEHCCPSGTTCDTGSGKCNRGLEQLDWFTKTESLKVGNVKCDSTHECPTGNTCCKLASGDWGCCPIPNAVCCSDHEHCCPSGTTCDTGSGKCNRGLEQIDWFTKTVSLKVGNVKCDSTHECPTGNTCCKLASGDWGCCPIPNAVCCSDHEHCCPSGTTCDTGSGKCNRGLEQIHWFTKTESLKVESVKCDSTHECPTGNTCCKLASGDWGCCPIPNAVCCSDHEHCCPSGTTCDTGSGKCNRGLEQIDWFTKTEALKVGNVKCDSTHECPTGNTCCKLASGDWGCCPIPNAVCCSDHEHCCPSGTTCDTGSGKCNRGVEQIDWFTKTESLNVGNVKCDSTHECPTGNTCCKLASGDWGCCPIPNAVCCSDHEHCCPSGTTCDTGSGKCNRGLEQIDWFTKTVSLKVGNVKCDSTHECPTGNTCCKLASGDWGCCPIPNAVCCSDHEHCCPSGTTCDTGSGKCNRGVKKIDWFTKTKSLKVGNVKCDSTHECPTGNTCCKLASGDWGCCPIPNAVCCSDHEHCCPSGTTCDTGSGKCNRGLEQIDWITKTESLKVENVKCDSTHECPTGNTCCKLASGDWGCCPIPNAVCCSDHEHCCPSGTTCDTGSGKCNRGLEQIDWFTKTESLKVESVKCDSTHECPTGNTCCKLASGDWGCCPIPNAVCCSDHEHCCPSGTTCDTGSGKCNRGLEQIDWFTKTESLKVGNVKCDSTHECPTGNTCCKLASGDWGCCPIPNAVCCSDHEHCCPSGTTCDTGSGKCNRGVEQIDWFTKTESLKVGNVKCDTTHECPDGNTCCKLASGDWGCCPIPNAVCCSDHEHCCPSGTTCDTGSGKCNRGLKQIDWFTKTESLKVGNVKCDSTHECPTGNTCCKLASGDWGCCPIPNAVCCSDHEHCCPSGTTCDTGSGKCNRGLKQIDWFTKTVSLKVGNVKCDSTHECPTGNTCCKLASGDWGCCPIPNAVCCSDHEHCCPSGTTCDTGSGKCNRGLEQIDWFTKTVSLKVGNVKCDSTHECPTGNTCCKLASGDWGCCPIPNAVCCSDHEHCCPSGTTCDTGSGKCNRGLEEIDWFEKVPAAQNTKDGSMFCPDGSECQDYQTCCKMSSHHDTYGCCPLPNAVCCSDGQHCCPKYYRCNLSTGTCVGGYRSHPMFRIFGHHLRNQDDTQSPELQLPGYSPLQLSESQLPARSSNNDVPVPSVDVQMPTKGTMCPDGKTCPDMNSCCDNGQGSYNCCPMPSGVCCDDHKHCCPNGYMCDHLMPGVCRIPETSRAASNLLRTLGSIAALKHNE